MGIERLPSSKDGKNELETCPRCNGTGKAYGNDKCGRCNGMGRFRVRGSALHAACLIEVEVWTVERHFIEQPRDALG